jgi:hypothetical protein
MRDRCSKRQSAITRQSEAFASLASDVSLFDPAQSLPSRTLTETLANVTDARPASIWALRDGGRIRTQSMPFTSTALPR